jgi:hypothetical protein
MTFTCKKCGMSFEDKKHYEIHKGVQNPEFTNMAQICHGNQVYEK